jgi:putative chitinase
MLKKGSEGPNVKILQEKLGIEPIGKFGPKTETAVKEYQKNNGLVQTGEVDDSLFNKIIGNKPTPSKVGFDISKLSGHIPDSVISQIPQIQEKFEINTPLRLSHFLAQCGHESGGFKLVTENLNYSAKGLLSIFKKYFPNEALAKSYERKPEKIANRVYSSRMGNGNEASGEGYKFRGRGYIQLTGKSNYAEFSRSIGEDCVAYPDLVASKYTLASAAWFFHKNGLHKIADEGASDVVVTKVTKRVNGGTIGLQDRISHFKEYYKLLS